MTTSLKQPNRFPIRPGQRRIAVVAECPPLLRAGDNYYDSVTGTRDALLREAGIAPEECFFGHVVQVPQPRGDAFRFKWESVEVVEGLDALRADLARYQPHFVLLLDWRGLAQRAFAGAKRSVDDWRGTLFESDFLLQPMPVQQVVCVRCAGKGVVEVVDAENPQDFAQCLICDGSGRVAGSDFLNTAKDVAGVVLGISTQQSGNLEVGDATSFVAHPNRRVKTLCTFHPTRLVMDYGLTGVVRFDLKRALVESRTDTLDVPHDRIAIDLTCADLLARLGQVRALRQSVAVDIEGYPTAISCIGFATGPNDAFVVPFARADGTSWWTLEEEVKLWEAVEGVLEDPAVPKICHNALYELFCLAWGYGIVICNLADDTMVMHFELFAELEKSLAFCTSIYTRHPFYKFERKATDDTTRLLYNGKDCCRTFEVWQVMRDRLAPKQREHYAFNVSLLIPLAYMSLRGIRYDYEKAQARLKSITKRIYALQDRVNREAAAGGKRPELEAFFQALGSGRTQNDPVCIQPENQDVQSGGEAACAEITTSKSSLANTNPLLSVLDDAPVGCGQGGSDNGRNHQTCSLRPLDPQALLPLLTSAFCQARRTEKREVEETSWQPMRWNGKKWVRGGKRVQERPEGQEVECAEGGTVISGPNETIWKPITKTITRNVTVEITTLADVARFTKDSCQDACKRARLLISRAQSQRGPWTPAQRGELATLLGLSVKINASGRDRDVEGEDGSVERGDERDANWFLYEHCGFPRQYIKEGNKLTDKLASDDEAVIKSWVRTKDRRAIWFLTLKRLKTQLKFYDAKPDADGHMRFGLNLVGTPTGRMAAYGSPTGSTRINPQTIPKKVREFYIAAPGCLLGQFDLDGSDSYTVAAYAASLGDRTMLDDNLARIKPAKVLALIYEHGPSVNRLSRDELKVECKKVDGEGWLYFACKRILHGSNYSMKEITMASQILTDSYKLTGKPIWLEPSVCKKIQDNAFFVRYPGVRRWHIWMAEELRTKGELVACNGFKRRFYARKNDPTTVRAALAHTPQVLTTYSINLTLSRMWNDVENRLEDGSLRVEPLLCVHDSVISQWKVEDTEFAGGKFKVWFNNPVNVRGIDFTIPANGGAGQNWLHQGGEKWKGYGGIDL